MTSEIATLQRFALAGRYDDLLERAKSDRHQSDTPIAPYALAGLTIATGNHVEEGGYRRLTPEESGTARNLFRTATTALARRLLREHPDLRVEALTHEFVRDHVGRGPLGRLPRSDVATITLRMLLNRPEYFTDLRDRGLLDWDDGDAAASMGIVYGWQRPLAGKKPPNILDVHDIESPLKVLTDARTVAPENDLLHLVEARYRLAWTDPMAVEEITVLREYADENDRGLRLAALAGLFDAGLRFGDPDLAKTALDGLRSVDENAAPIALPEVWLDVQTGDYTSARDQIDRLSYESAEIQAETGQVLAAIDAPAEAVRVLDGITPRSLPLEFAERFSIWREV